MRAVWLVFLLGCPTPDDTDSEPAETDTGDSTVETTDTDETDPVDTDDTDVPADEGTWIIGSILSFGGDTALTPFALNLDAEPLEAVLLPNVEPGNGAVWEMVAHPSLPVVYQMVFTSNPDGARIDKVELPSGDRTEIQTDAGFPLVSADGSHLIFNNPDGETLVRGLDAEGDPTGTTALLSENLPTALVGDLWTELLTVEPYTGAGPVTLVYDLEGFTDNLPLTGEGCRFAEDGDLYCHYNGAIRKRSLSGEYDPFLEVDDLPTGILPLDLIPEDFNAILPIDGRGLLMSVEGYIPETFSWCSSVGLLSDDGEWTDLTDVIGALVDPDVDSDCPNNRFSLTMRRAHAPFN